MVIRDLLKMASEKLENLEYIDPINEANLILAKVMDRDLGYLYANLDLEVDEEIKNSFLEKIEIRSKGYPFHYIFKEKSFLDLDIYIEEGVLIPRYETEILVEFIIDYCNENYMGEKIRILDIGTGSGVIAISLAKHLKNSDVVGLDINKKALEVANINKDKYNLTNVEFIESDLFENLEDEKFNIIISNPPYIETSELDKLQLDVREYEPMTALDGGEDGLYFYRRIIGESKDYIENNGMLAFEIGYNQARSIEELLEADGFRNIEVIKDLQGHDRIIWGLTKEV